MLKVNFTIEGKTADEAKFGTHEKFLDWLKTTLDTGQVTINFMKEYDYKFNISEIHGAIVDKFYIRNKENTELCALDNHPASNTGLPLVFNTEEEAQHYLMMVDDINDTAEIVPTHITFFDNGGALYEESPDGISVFGFGED